MDVVKNIAAIVGCIISCITLITLVCKPFRQKIVSFIRKSSNQNEVENQLAEIKRLLETRAQEAHAFQEKVEQALDITTDFTKAQCRGIIKDAFYAYRDTRILPLYEKKRLMDIEEIYIKRLHQNHWGKALLDVMAEWEVDTSKTDANGIEDE